MSTIASPRPSSSIRSPSSTRTSFEATARPAANPRRNRAALRDYYGLKSAAAAPKDADSKISEESARTDLGPELEEETLTELDKQGFDANGFVDNILATSGLSGVLKVEADLISQIRNLDSDRKSLVYDNYSKLLSATSTIRKMRTNMDPLAPTTHTLGPAISHIAETAAGLSSSMQALQKPAGLGIEVQVEGEEDAELARKRSRRDTVQWVLDTPRRLSALVDEDKEEEAEKEWAEVSKILDKWKGVPGVDDLRQQCEEIMAEEEESE
ncbi:hypothetical protein BU24DRAFT_168004 [Aaosphaeria arxii CBS 175.79]|uniref:Vacuolar protein sorting-associated protein 51 homolog n=1 Tax=Aaosphaeria arxii CBS 175.79 TaxID=1450172 RepID=A0A6A5XZQ6_9PLEO|nr:uncharacterized protein BU24DRAFT_168004 [Aaosphaeria arxii CBS 175.79]KAF2018287.1 hypothetical protein BU24DRAFT_168004 [Aaosphaeria arxii CBS 175.79]